MYFKFKKKTVPVTGPVVAQRVGRGIALLFHDHGTRRGLGVSSTPRPYFTPEKDQYPFYRRLGGSQGRSGKAENLAPLGFDPQTVQPVVSRYTDWATRSTCTSSNVKNNHIYIFQPYGNYRRFLMTNVSNQKVFMFHFSNLRELIINNYYEKCNPWIWQWTWHLLWGKADHGHRIETCRISLKMNVM